MVDVTESCLDESKAVLKASKKDEMLVVLKGEFLAAVTESMKA